MLIAGSAGETNAELRVRTGERRAPELLSAVAAEPMDAAGCEASCADCFGTARPARFGAAALMGIHSGGDLGWLVGALGPCCSLDIGAASTTLASSSGSPSAGCSIALSGCGAPLSERRMRRLGANGLFMRENGLLDTESGGRWAARSGGLTVCSGGLSACSPGGDA